MPKLPQVSGKQTIKIFQKLGYKISHQKGSHVRLHCFSKEKFPLTIPLHKILGRGLLRKILRDAEISVDEFIKLLKK